MTDRAAPTDAAASHLLDLAVFYGLVLLVIWGGQWVGVRPPGGLAAVLIAGFCWRSARRHGDGRERLGWDHRWLGRSARLTLLWAGPPVAALILWAAMPPWPSAERLLYGARGAPAWMGGWPPWAVALAGALRYPPWALAQEFALLSFSANRWRGAVPNPWTASFLNGACFAAVHAPNPILMTAGLIGGTVFTRIFYAAPHILPPAAAHLAAGLALSVVFRDFHPAMMVGPAYLRFGR